MCTNSILMESNDSINNADLFFLAFLLWFYVKILFEPLLFTCDYVVAIECCSRLFYSIRLSPINESDKRHSKHSRAKKFSVTTKKCHFSSFIACYLMTQFQYSVICDRCAAVCWMQIGITLKRHTYLKNKKKFRRSSKWFTFACINEKTRKFCLK